MAEIGWRSGGDSGRNGGGSRASVGRYHAAGGDCNQHSVEVRANPFLTLGRREGVVESSRPTVRWYHMGVPR